MTLGHSARRIPLGSALLASVLLAAAAPLAAQSLRGSQSSLQRQNAEARRHGFTFLQTPSDVIGFVEKGILVPVTPNNDFVLKEVSFPYARPEVRTFVERLAHRYHEVCREELVVTSLTRARTRQPSNASRQSVHPTGMALDLRRSWSRGCRAWLEGVLLTMEQQGLLEAALERNPPHYHIALFPSQYRAYLRQLEHDPAEHEFQTLRYRVARGDTLHKIAREHRTTIEAVKASNGLRSSLIYPGQVLVIPRGD